MEILGNFANSVTLVVIIALILHPAPARSQNSRVIGGEIVEHHKYPSIAAVLRIHEIEFFKQEHICGGAILNNEWILTAAHCVPTDEDILMCAILGVNNFTRERIDYESCNPNKEGSSEEERSSGDVGRQKVYVVQTIVHEKYKPERGLHDIALLRVEPKINFTKEVQPIKLPHCKVDETGEAWAAGWGAADRGPLELLKEIKLHVIKNEECIPRLPPPLQKLGTTRFCVQESSKGMSIGDDGGPLYMVDRNGTMRLVGISSVYPGECGGEHPGIFIRVSHYVGWIHRRKHGQGSRDPQKRVQQEKGRSYRGYQVKKVTPTTVDQMRDLLELRKQGVKLLAEFIPGQPGHPVHILVPPNFTPLDSLQAKGVEIETLIEDFGKYSDAKRRQKGITGCRKLAAFADYATVEEIYEFLQEMAANHSSTTELINIGKSFEGRDMWVLKIATGKSPKPVILIDSLIHAREWMTGAVVTFTINELLNGKDMTVRGWLDDFDFYFVPVVNPDGYAYTFTQDRLWRKNRRPNPNSTEEQCQGVDLNRNWDIGFGIGEEEKEPCFEVYRGEFAFSEPETQNMRDLIMRIKDKLVGYFNVHTAAQLILFPWGYTNEKIPQYDTYKALGTQMAKALAERKGTQYRALSTAEFFAGSNYMGALAGGLVMDWVKRTYNPNISWTIELREDGKYLFFLPPEYIIPDSLEFLDGLKVVVDALRVGVPTPPLPPDTNHSSETDGGGAGGKSRSGSSSVFLDWAN